jgi:aminoglycoside phosphotransferase
MRSLSTTTTDLTDFVSLDTRPSFRNQVRLGVWRGVRAYKKDYPEREYWETEVSMLSLLKDHPYIITPAIYGANEDSLSVVMSEIPGQRLEHVDSELVTSLAVTLRVLHQEQGARALVRMDMLKRLQLFHGNIAKAACLTADESKQAMQALRILDRELRPVIDESNDVVHGDFNLGNVLFNKVSRKLGLIDFERSFVGLGLVDLAKGAWRILNHNTEAVDLLLHAYYGRVPTSDERRLFCLVSVLEYLGAISYFALEGHANGYPYKDEAFKHLKQCLSQF